MRKESTKLYYTLLRDCTYLLLLENEGHWKSDDRRNPVLKTSKGYQNLKECYHGISADKPIFSSETNEYPPPLDPKGVIHAGMRQYINKDYYELLGLTLCGMA